MMFKPEGALRCAKRMRGSSGFYPVEHTREDRDGSSWKVHVWYENMGKSKIAHYPLVRKKKSCLVNTSSGNHLALRSPGPAPGWRPAENGSTSSTGTTMKQCKGNNTHCAALLHCRHTRSKPLEIIGTAGENCLERVKYLAHICLKKAH